MAHDSYACHEIYRLLSFIKSIIKCSITLWPGLTSTLDFSNNQSFALHNIVWIIIISRLQQVDKTGQCTK